MNPKFAQRYGALGCCVSCKDHCCYKSQNFSKQRGARKYSPKPGIHRLNNNGPSDADTQVPWGSKYVISLAVQSPVVL